MPRFKQFSGGKRELEEGINSWLAEFEPDVRHMAQTEGREGDLIVSFLYTESFRGQELRIAEEHGMGQAEPPVPTDVFPDKPITVPQEPGGIATDSP